MHEKPIVIAGGSGFLGISLATYLTALGRKVVILSRGVPKVAGPWQHVEWDARTLGQLGMLKELFKSHFVCDVFLQRSFIKTRQPVDHLMQFLFGPAFLFNLCKIMRDTEENVIFAIRSSCSFARFILRYPFYSLCIRQELLAEDLR